eukprot:TRINITY_DN17756_c0_g3_i1.p1 TRINITY_DN17756_c0_g3~~TRINITY_DN17756_c0_g3_i1.p1  ORF type:complete len:997 (-),score=192.73 TRINITY_DN17756_c0_g3_i1:73-3063(-)
MKHLFGSWHGGLGSFSNASNSRSGAGTAAGASAAAVKRGGESLAADAARLVRLCQDLEEQGWPGPLRTVSAPITQLGTAVASRLPSGGPALGLEALQDLQRAIRACLDLLARCDPGPSAWLSFVLEMHGDEAFRTQVESTVECALDLLAEPPVQACDSSPSADWRDRWAAASAGCLEIWEWHVYFVFLDLKGDLALMEQTGCTLLRLLGCSSRALVCGMERTRPHVESALRALADRQHQPMLERLHAESLRGWRDAWLERRGREEDQPSQKFWETYFTHLYKITWPDFAEAFEHFYLFGRCPVDILAKLRPRMDPGSRHLVLRTSWQRIRRPCIWELVDELLQEVLEDVGECVYRPVPLSPLDAESVAAAMAPREAAASQSAARSPAQPWVPFAHSVDDGGDMAIPTPHDLLLRYEGASEFDSRDGEGRDGRPTSTWDGLVAKLCEQRRPWWIEPGESPTLEAISEDEPLRMAALRAVSSTIAYTHRALIFRVVSGDLAQNVPVLEAPRRSSSMGGEGTPAGGPGSEGGGAEAQLLPALVITANGTRFSGVTKFGRTSSRRTLLPDFPMSEPIASRSHFNVIYEQACDRYFLMDAGSKWGTFVKIGSRMTLKCGDWIRVGGVEFIIRYCGGGCSSKDCHSHYRLHSLRLVRDHQSCGPCDGSDAAGFGVSSAGGLHGGIGIRPRHSRSTGDVVGLGGLGKMDELPLSPLPSGGKSRLRSVASFPLLAGGLLDLPEHGGADVDDNASASSEEHADAQLNDELLLLLGSRKPQAWMPASSRVCRQASLVDAGTPDNAKAAASSSTTAAGDGESARTSCAKSRTEQKMAWQEAVEANCEPPCSPTSPTQLPIAPLELDFISGPRMGEKIVITERVCTLGRGEGNTIQVSDSQLNSVSRVHCIFEYVGNRWCMRDNDSTNGTWRRLSCVLEPSSLVPLQEGLAIQAGVHEFLVEEAEMRQWWAPSLALACFDSLLERDRELEHARRANTAAAPATQESGS